MNTKEMNEAHIKGPAKDPFKRGVRRRPVHIGTSVEYPGALVVVEESAVKDAPFIEHIALSPKAAASLALDVLQLVTIDAAGEIDERDLTLLERTCALLREARRVG